MWLLTQNKASNIFYSILSSDKGIGASFPEVFNATEKDIFSDFGQFQNTASRPPELRKLQAANLHPNLYFNQDDVPLLRQRSTTTHSHIFKVIQTAVLMMLSAGPLYMPPTKHEEFTSKWNEIYGNNLPPQQSIFVSEALYGPKYSFLNNVLVFSPSPTSQCNVPWEGQLGECAKWLRWTDRGVGDSAGELIAASAHGDAMFVRGEAVAAYSSAMRLKSTLVVVDHVEKRDSPVNAVSAFFHNLDIVFKYVPHSFTDSYNGALMEFWDAHYKMYVLHGPYVKVSNCRFIESRKNGLKLSLVINNTEKIVSVVTNHRDIGARSSYLGFGGYAKVEDRHQVIHFGLGTQLVPKQTKLHNHLFDFGVTVNVIAGVILCVAIVFLTLQRKFYICFSRLMRYALLSVLMLWITELLFVSNSCDQLLCKVKWRGATTDPEFSKQMMLYDQHQLPLPTVVITTLPGSGSDILKHLFYNNTYFVYLRIPTEHLDIPETEFEFDSLVNACEWTWSEAQCGHFKMIQGWLHSLVHNTHLFLQNIPFHDTSPLKPAQRVSVSLDKRRRLRRREFKAEMKGRVRVDRDVEYVRELRRHTLDYPNARVVLNLCSGSWALKLPFLQEVIGPSLRAIYIVRDPRAWIYLMLYNSKPSLYSLKNIPQHLALIFHQDMVSDKCPTAFAAEFRKLWQLISRSETNPVLLLAHLWLAHTAAVLRVTATLSEESYLQVRFEDVVTYPQETAEKIHSFLGIPVSPSALNQLMFTTSTNLYNLMYEGDISPASIDKWRRNMPRRDIRLIEYTCGFLMRQLGYHRFTD
uniref:Sulfotransferase domain-containing protein n=1 Tax=Cyprinus carpio carpio TaxID=630221 RepID=A0A8C1I2G8_CYPCA